MSTPMTLEEAVRALQNLGNCKDIAQILKDKTATVIGKPPNPVGCPGWAPGMDCCIGKSGRVSTVMISSSVQPCINLDFGPALGTWAFALASLKFDELVTEDKFSDKLTKQVSDRLEADLGMMHKHVAELLNGKQVRVKKDTKSKTGCSWAPDMEASKGKIGIIKNTYIFRPFMEPRLDYVHFNLEIDGSLRVDRWYILDWCEPVGDEQSAKLAKLLEELNASVKAFNDVREAATKHIEATIASLAK